MSFLISKSSLIFIVILMCSEGESEIDTFIRLTSSLQSIDCRDSSNQTIPVDIQSRNQPFSISDLSNGSIKIVFDEIPRDHVLLTFNSDQSNVHASNDIDCWSPINDSMVVDKLYDGETQMFCLMEKDASTVSPLDCLSILPRNSASDSDSVWLTEDDKSLAIGLLVMGLVICLGVGFAFGLLIVKRQAKAQNYGKQSGLARPDLISSDWRSSKANESYPYSDNDTISVASDQYVAAVNPSRFDLIKMRLEKSEKPEQNEGQNQYDLEDMPYSKAPSAPEGFRDSGISTGGPIYAISAKVKERNDLLDNVTPEDLYLCVDHDENAKKNE
ncbi:uncharacterized protein LOC119074378 [Bradysia coprophila]|uniref:uncharacterized protein LOC119074378 n=1 Tax=Bradysia coprophila TaxID=38358 RepID=UPI00187D8435|nr:uncharacterized protein LOC119074378 [Bradysia coprophila]